MDDFKRIVKMKAGGSVSKAIASYEKRERKTEEKDDIAQDKKVVKKAFSIHDTQQHEEKTDLSKLKKGGRAKKECGTVKKYKTGGTVENAYGAKKTDKDIKDIANSKKQKPVMLCGGKSVKKMAMGGEVAAPAVDPVQAKLAMLEKQRQMEKMARAKKYLGPSQQSELINQSPAAAGLSGGNMGAGAPGGMGQAAPIPGGMKKGGKAKKYSVGGAIAKAAKSQLFPGAFMGAAVAPGVYSDMKAQDRKAAEEAAKDKEAEAKSAPVAKKRGGKC